MLTNANEPKRHAHHGYIETYSGRPNQREKGQMMVVGSNAGANIAFASFPESVVVAEPRIRKNFYETLLWETFDMETSCGNETHEEDEVEMNSW